MFHHLLSSFLLTAFSCSGGLIMIWLSLPLLYSWWRAVMVSILSMHLFLLTQNSLFVVESSCQNWWLVAFFEELERAVCMVL